MSDNSVSKNLLAKLFGVSRQSIKRDTNVSGWVGRRARLWLVGQPDRDDKVSGIGRKVVADRVARLIAAAEVVFRPGRLGRKQIASAAGFSRLVGQMVIESESIVQSIARWVTGLAAKLAGLCGQYRPAGQLRWRRFAKVLDASWLPRFTRPGIARMMAKRELPDPDEHRERMARGWS